MVGVCTCDDEIVEFAEVTTAAELDAGIIVAVVAVTAFVLGVGLTGEGVSGLAKRPIREVGRSAIAAAVVVTVTGVVEVVGDEAVTSAVADAEAAAAAAAAPCSSCFSKAFCKE